MNNYIENQLAEIVEKIRVWDQEVKAEKRFGRREER
jgi:hypothetical protein